MKRIRDGITQTVVPLPVGVRLFQRFGSFIFYMLSLHLSSVKKREILISYLSYLLLRRLPFTLIPDTITDRTMLMVRVARIKQMDQDVGICM